MRLGLLLGFVGAIFLEAFQGTSQRLPPHPPSLPMSERAKRPDIPMLQPEPTDSQQKAIRDARSKIFTNGGPLLALDSSGYFHFLLIADMRGMHELPDADDGVDVVLYGEVTRSQIFVNSRKQGLYTDYTVKVGRTLRPVDEQAEGTEVSVLRIGGLARLPSGGVIEHEIRGYGPEPAVGSQYLFFLKRLPEPASAYTFFKFWNVVPQSDGGSPIVKAAFDADLMNAKNNKSEVDGKSIAEVSRMIQSAR